MRIRLTRRQNLRFLWALVIIGIAALAFCAAYMVNGKIWEKLVWQILILVVIAGDMVEIGLVRIIHPPLPEARTLTDEEQLRSIRGGDEKHTQWRNK